LSLSFRGGAKRRARNLEIPRSAIAHLRSGPSDHPGMTWARYSFRFEFQTARTQDVLWIVIASVPSTLAARASQGRSPPKRMRRVGGSEAIHRAARKRMDCFIAAAPRNDVETQVRDLAAPAREFCHQRPALLNRGRRECRAPDAPAAACVVVESTRVSHHGHTGNTRHSPRNGFTVSFALSPVTGLSCHRRRRKLVFANLTPASGRQDHTTSPSARCAFSSATPPASIASRRPRP
jgi:hypothetical protein